MEIINSNFYQDTSSQGAIFAFYPLYPLLVAIFSLGFIPLEISSLAINTVASFLACLALYEICLIFTQNKKASYASVLIFLGSPAAFFMHSFYGEAVFIAIGAWAYLFCLRRQWLWAGILLAFLTAARLPAILFVGLCALELLRSYKWNPYSALLARPILWLLLAPAGFIAYSTWCYFTSGDVLAMFHAYKAPDGWPYQVFNPNIFATYIQSAIDVIKELRDAGITKTLIVNYLLPAMSIIVLAGSSLYLLLVMKGRAVPLAIFGIFAAIMFSLNSNLISVHRYSLACISIFITCALLLSKYRTGTLVFYCAFPLLFTLQMGLFALFITGNFAG
jgi:hypothetical protein